MKKYKIILKPQFLEVEDGNEIEDLEDVIVNFIMSITENYNDYFEFEEVKDEK